MNEKLEEYIMEQLDRFPEKDVVVYYKGYINLTYGFFVWSGYSHVETTIAELRQEGFEKSDIKELRDEAKKIVIIEKEIGEFDVQNVEKT